MQEQQWNLSVNQLETFLKQAQLLMLDQLPLDLRSLTWTGDSAPEEQLACTLQGLEFDLDIEREGFRQWYLQQGNALNQPRRLNPQWLWVAGLVGLVGLGSYLAWQSTNTLKVNLEASNPAIEEPTTSAPVPDTQPAPSANSSATSMAESVVGAPMNETPAMPTAPVATEEPPVVSAPAPKIKPAAQPVPSSQTKVLPVASESITKTAPPVQPEVPKIKQSPTKPRLLARVIVVASSPEETENLKKEFPRSFPKSCDGGDETRQCFQVGAFKTTNNAQSFAGKLRLKGYEVDVIAPSDS